MIKLSTEKKKHPQALKINNWRRKASEREFWKQLGEEEAKTKIGIIGSGRENETTENFSLGTTIM